MKPDRGGRHFIFAFLIALGAYVVLYQVIEHWRLRKAPWEVTFTHAPDDAPMLIVLQPDLGITNYAFTFPGEHWSGTNTTMRFIEPHEVPYDMPFGKCIFRDTTFFPGSVTFNLFNHEIELLPRVLVLDHREVPWRANVTNVMAASAAKSP